MSNNKFLFLTVNCALDVLKVDLFFLKLFFIAAHKFNKNDSDLCMTIILLCNQKNTARKFKEFIIFTFWIVVVVAPNRFSFFKKTPRLQIKRRKFHYS